VSTPTGLAPLSSTGSPEKKEPKLLDRVREALRVRHLSLRTEVAADPKHLGARIGLLAVLHTWARS
jgi:hypothetical protein